MGATTPKYALPYPLGTDRVMDGDNAIQALAERVEAVLEAPVAGEAWPTANNSIPAYGNRWIFLHASELTGGFALANSTVPSLGGSVPIRLVVPAAGRYLVSAQLEFDYPGSPGNVLCGVGIFLNQPGELVWPTGCIARGAVHPMQEHTNAGTVNTYTVRQLAANDWLSMAGIHNWGGSAEIGGAGRIGSHLSAVRLR